MSKYCGAYLLLTISCLFLSNIPSETIACSMQYISYRQQGGLQSLLTAVCRIFCMSQWCQSQNHDCHFVLKCNFSDCSTQLQEEKRRTDSAVGGGTGNYPSCQTQHTTGQWPADQISLRLVRETENIGEANVGSVDGTRTWLSDILNWYHHDERDEELRRAVAVKL